MTLYSIIDNDHQRLGQILRDCQVAIVDKRPSLALQLFRQLAESQRQHIRFENEQLLSLLAKVDAPRWQALVYQKEHDKVEKLLASYEQVLVALPETLSSEQVIDALDQMHALKHVLEHHEQREEKGLLPELDRILSAEQLEYLQQQFSQYCPR